MKTDKDDLVTRHATLDEIGVLLSWAENEGWNPGIGDAGLFYEADESGYFVSYLNDVLVAGISVVKQNDKHAFLGLYLCHPEYRGKGIGLKTWNAGLSSVGARCVGLDGVVDQQENYSRSGFSYVHRNVRYAGPISQLISELESSSTNNGIKTSLATIEDLNAVVEYDAHVGGLERPTFYKAWLKNHSTRKTMIAMANERIVGVAGIRQCASGYKVGPWLADNATVASTLIYETVKPYQHESVMIDIPEPNRAAAELLQSSGFAPVFETARMYRGAAPSIDTDRLFGVATLELG